MILPKFNLPATDGKNYSNSFFENANAKLVVFSCNHCPYVKGSDEALIKAVGRFEDSGLKTLAISSNNAEQYPEDSFEKMKEKSSTMKLPFPYLYDETQSVAKAFNAECTPECFLFDKNDKLVYHGTVNDSPRYPEKVTKNHLELAISQLLDNQKVEPSYVHPIGCSIKWK